MHAQGHSRWCYTGCSCAQTQPRRLFFFALPNRRVPGIDRVDLVQQRGRSLPGAIVVVVPWKAWRSPTEMHVQVDDLRTTSTFNVDDDDGRWTMDDVRSSSLPRKAPAAPNAMPLSAMESVPYSLCLSHTHTLSLSELRARFILLGVVFLAASSFLSFPFRSLPAFLVRFSFAAGPAA